MTQPVAIDVERLDKTFRIPEQRMHTLKERALHPFRRTRYTELHVLQDISFRIMQGEFFGILGRNGSGKSTLLKCLAGIYRADTGRIAVAGRLAPFIELGVGFNPNLTANENVAINAVMMGLTPAEARDRFDDIIAFAELEDFVDLKLKNYSSGMQVRLAFATMVQSDADVMLIDEVLAVGDAAFQQKCFEVFDRLREEGKTIILVTHDLRLVERFCDRAMVIHEHRIDSIGDPERVAQRYLDVNFVRALTTAEGGEVEDELAVLDAWTEHEGERTESLPFGATADLCVEIEPAREIPDPEIRVWIENEEGTRVFAASTLEFGRDVDPLAPGERRRLRVHFENRFVSDTYHVSVLVRSHRRPDRVSGVRHRAARFGVVGGEHVGGVVDIEHSLEFRRVEDRTRT